MIYVTTNQVEADDHGPTRFVVSERLAPIEQIGAPMDAIVSPPASRLRCGIHSARPRMNFFAPSQVPRLRPVCNA